MLDEDEMGSALPESSLADGNGDDAEDGGGADGTAGTIAGEWDGMIGKLHLVFVFEQTPKGELS